MTSKITPAVRAAIEAAVGAPHVFDDPEKAADYGHDEFSLPEIARVPDLVVRPGATEEVAAVLRLANEHGVPVTPRGGATGLCGGCVPVHGGIVLSLERMDRVLEVDADNQMAVTEAGVRLSDFVRAVEAAGLYFPPHPGDESAMMGGLVATNAGGSRAVKYGTIRNYVRGLELVTAAGDVLRLGGKLEKSSTGYNLMHLVVGSEGTLGVVTKVVLHLKARPGLLRSLVVPFEALEPALETVPLIMKRGIVPLAVEFLEVEPIAITEEHIGKTWPTKLGKTHLLVILDAPTEEEIDRLSQATAEVCCGKGAIDVFIADTPSKQDDVLAIRSKIYDAIKAGTVEVLDIAVPRAEVAGHVRFVREVAAKYDIWLPTFGHAADGNVHTHIMKVRCEAGRMAPVPESVWRPKTEAVRTELFRDCRARGGVISGEHGIGLVKKPYLPLVLDERQIALMRAIRRAFDPRGIMNPGKVFD
ncbi:MAG TPA: FAD-linked oxidase C-terminal domain-containing protein [Candidatus Aminicenantes bacterium]|nr:FAD-linked oxidase C-terminal domain-containing protein [Candidatus Aminicenantes bacterium]